MPKATKWITAMSLASLVVASLLTTTACDSAMKSEMRTIAADHAQAEMSGQQDAPSMESRLLESETVKEQAARHGLAGVPELISKLQNEKTSWEAMLAISKLAGENESAKSALAAQAVPILRNIMQKPAESKDDLKPVAAAGTLMQLTETEPGAIKTLLDLCDSKTGRGEEGVFVAAHALARPETAKLGNLEIPMGILGVKSEENKKGIVELLSDALQSEDQNKRLFASMALVRLGLEHTDVRALAERPEVKTALQMGKSSQNEFVASMSEIFQFALNNDWILGNTTPTEGR